MRGVGLLWGGTTVGWSYCGVGDNLAPHITEGVGGGGRTLPTLRKWFDICSSIATYIPVHVVFRSKMFSTLRKLLLMTGTVCM